MRESILIFGGKNLKEMEEDGGIGWWYVNQERAENLEYAVYNSLFNSRMGYP